MSRGHARSAIAARVAEAVAHWELPYKGAEAVESRTPAVVEQLLKVENDSVPDVPAVVVQVGEVTQAGDVRTGAVTIIGLVYAKDSEQGYRDAENLIEYIEIQLVSDPWLDDGAYKLIGPWKSIIDVAEFPVFSATLTCNVELPSIGCVMAPAGPLEDMI